MKLSAKLVLSLAFCSLAWVAGPASAADIPCKTAKLIVPWKAGGGTHVIFSIFEKTIQNLDVTPKIKVVTVPGQGGNKGAKEARKAKPDGCTLFAIHQSAITSYLNGRIDFSFEAFDTVALLTATPDIVGAAGNAPWNTLAELEEAAKAAPGTVPGTRAGKLALPFRIVQSPSSDTGAGALGPGSGPGARGPRPGPGARDRRLRGF